MQTSRSKADREPSERPQSPVTGTVDVELVETFAAKDLAALVRRRIGATSLFDGVSTMGLWRCKASGLKFFDTVICGDAAFYSMLNKHEWYYSEEKPEYSEAAKLIRSGDKVLDVGCGAGNFAPHLPQGASFKGLELTESSIELARSRGRDVIDQTVEDHASELPGHYDVVTSFHVVEHVPRPMQFMESMTKCLKAGGKIVVAVPNDESFAGSAVNYLLNLPPHHVTRWTPGSLAYVFEALGLVDVTLWKEELSPLHYEIHFHDLLVRAAFGARRRPLPVVNSGIAFRLASKMLKLPSRWLQRAIIPSRPFATGETMMAVGTKDH